MYNLFGTILICVCSFLIFDDTIATSETTIAPKLQFEAAFQGKVKKNIINSLYTRLNLLVYKTFFFIVK